MLLRREVLILGAAALAAACNGAGAGASDASDMAIGPANAPVTLIEYASTTCPHCAEFHETVFTRIKAEYIDTGRIRYVFREFPTPPAQVAVAGFQLARCGGATPEQYMTRVGVLFEQQRQMLGQGATIDTIRADLIALGAQAGLSQEQVLACINDEAGAERIRATVEAARNQFQVNGTPTFILNGRKLEDPSVLTYEGMKRALDAALG